MGNTTGPLHKVPPKEFYNGTRKSEVLQRIADGTGSQYHGFLTVGSGMSEINPMKNDKGMMKKKNMMMKPKKMIK